MNNEERGSRIIVLLLTDIIDSVALENRLGNPAYSRLIKLHHQLLIQAVNQFQGAVRYDTGDQVVCELRTAAHAVRAALLFQMLLREAKWDIEGPQVRVGIHQGRISVTQMDAARPGRPVGMPVNIAARVMGMAQAGQILMTRPVYDDAKLFIHAHPDGIHWEAHGAYLFKGAEELIDVFEVRVESAVKEQWPDAPDYEIFDSPIRTDGFGKSWIVRNTVGQWRILEAIYQSNFCGHTEFYEAQFRGVQKFQAISEKHPSLLRIEMVSKMKSEGYFYYVTELGDALTPGWEGAPSHYRLKDLESLRNQARERRLPINDCRRIIVALAKTLSFLHQEGLVHRDIKPSNVIFVNNQPKLAGIGLVTDIQPEADEMAGTSGYMPPSPERSGTIQADIYALGMVLYVISTGNEPQLFPEIRETIMEGGGNEGFLEINTIILKACQPNVAHRYSAVSQMLGDLEKLGGPAEAPPPRVREQRRMDSYDVFVSAKSEDYELARSAAKFLRQSGLRVFFSEEELQEIGNSDYFDAIDTALEGAQHMLVVTTSRVNVSSRWVKKEWQTYLNEKLSGRKRGNLVTLLCNGMKIEDLPLSLRQHEARPDADLPSLLRYFRS